MATYSKIPIFSGHILADYHEYDDRVDFALIIEYGEDRVVYKTWSRKKFGQFDPYDLPEIEPRATKLAAKFQSMGEKMFLVRLQTLKATRQ